jgi:hypothetical protein
VFRKQVCATNNQIGPFEWVYPNNHSNGITV